MSNEDYLIYKPKSNDTLTLLAKRVGIHPVALAQFHNKHCKSENIIYSERLSYYKSILVPLNFKSKEEIDQDQRSERPSSTFLSSFYENRYTIKETYETNVVEEFLIESTLNLSFRKDEGKDIVSITRTNFTKNNEAIETKASLLSIETMKGISPLSFFISSNGELTSFFDYNYFLEMFLHSRKKIEEYYTGETTKNYLDKFEESIKNETIFFNKISQTLLYKLLFPKLDWFCKKSNWKEKIVIYPNSFPVVCEFSADYNHKDENYATTILRGKTDDLYSFNEIINGIKTDEEPENNFLGEIILKYKTHKETKKLKNASAEIILWQNEEKKFRHSIEL